jgi:DNA-binding transcriptional LysR family regulator
MNLHHLRIFYTVAQRRSVTAAAEELLLSQPAVSLQLKALERELGVALFERGGARLQMTQAGDVLYRSAVSMLHAKDEAERAIAELRDGTRGRLILGAGTTGGMYVLPRILQAYTALWPETEILLQIGTTDQLLDKLAQNVLDMGLVGGPVEDRRFVVEPVCEDELVVIVAPTHPLASRGTVTLRDLGAAPFIVPEAGSRTRLLVERKLRDAGVPLRIALQMPGTEGVKRAVEAGLGVGIVSGCSVEAECSTGVLRRIPVAGWRLARTMNLVYRAQKYFAPVGERFREFARSYAARYPERLAVAAHAGMGEAAGAAPGSRPRATRAPGAVARSGRAAEKRQAG